MAKAKEKKAEVVPFKPAALAPAKLPEGMKVVRHVTLPSLAIKKEGQTEILTIMDEMRVSKITQSAGKDAEGKEKKKEPATICTAGKHGTGELVTFIVPAVVKANLIRDYTDDGKLTPQKTYVGKTFMISNRGKRTESQRYNDFEIMEVDVPAAK